jgi:hypothetical protein
MKTSVFGSKSIDGGESWCKKNFRSLRLRKSVNLQNNFIPIYIGAVLLLHKKHLLGIGKGARFNSVEVNAAR